MTEGHSRHEADRQSEAVERLQDSFSFRNTADGGRAVMVIGNEREKGCPFRCKGCGVHEHAVITSKQDNATIIEHQVDAIARELAPNEQDTESDYHMYVFNNGNITNKQELSRDNLSLLLQKINGLRPQPDYVGINSRGQFVNEELLSFITDMNLGYDVRFVLGTESLTEKGGEIYGKPHMKKELGDMFNTIDEFNEHNNTQFGIDMHFVFLPEFYADDRNDQDAVQIGFVNDIMTAIDSYTGKHTPIKININPYYKMDTLQYESTFDFLGIIVEGIKEVNKRIEEKEFPDHLKPSIFIGIEDPGYETDEWTRALAAHRDEIERLNSGNVGVVID